MRKKLEKLLKEIGFTEESWNERIECTKEQFLGLLYNRVHNYMGIGLKDMMELAKVEGTEIFNNLGEWIDDSKIDYEKIGKIGLLMNEISGCYYNLQALLKLRIESKDLYEKSEDKDFIYLVYDAKEKGADCYFNMMDRKQYNEINDEIEKYKKKKDEKPEYYV